MSPLCGQCQACNTFSLYPDLGAPISRQTQKPSTVQTPLTPATLTSAGWPEILAILASSHAWHLSVIFKRVSGMTFQDIMSLFPPHEDQRFDHGLQGLNSWVTLVLQPSLCLITLSLDKPTTFQPQDLPRLSATCFHPCGTFSSPGLIFPDAPVSSTENCIGHMEYKRM